MAYLNIFINHRIPSVKANQLPQHLFDVYEEAFDLLDSQQKGVIGE